MTSLTKRGVRYTRRNWRSRRWSESEDKKVQAGRGRDRHGIDYLSVLPQLVPNGKVLVHNQVSPVSLIPDMRGSRCWLQNPSGRLEPCDCDWAPGLGVHFRVCR